MTNETMLLTAQQIANAYTCPLARVEKWLPHLSEAMYVFEINTLSRQTCFLAQVGHESGRLVHVREIWNPIQCAWQARYEGRASLGNTQPGDGARFKGRGLIQITGRYNYKACGKALGIDLEQEPDLLERPDYAALSAAWFWREHGCNELADAGKFFAITRVINGGTNGIDDRLSLLKLLTSAIDEPE